MQSGFRGAPSTACEQVLDSVAILKTHGGTVLPPCDCAPLGVHESLIENMVEDVLKIENVRGVADVEELRPNLWGDLLVGARRLMVGNPEVRSLGLRVES